MVVWDQKPARCLPVAVHQTLMLSSSGTSTNGEQHHQPIPVLAAADVQHAISLPPPPPPTSLATISPIRTARVEPRDAAHPRGMGPRSPAPLSVQLLGGHTRNTRESAGGIGGRAAPRRQDGAEKAILLPQQRLLPDTRIPASVRPFSSLLPVLGHPAHLDLWQDVRRVVILCFLLAEVLAATNVAKSAKQRPGAALTNGPTMLGQLLGGQGDKCPNIMGSGSLMLSLSHTEPQGAMGLSVPYSWKKWPVAQREEKKKTCTCWRSPKLESGLNEFRYNEHPITTEMNEGKTSHEARSKADERWRGTCITPLYRGVNIVTGAAVRK
ncbi:hypothetical protein DFH06DRAFT_1150294 [Mycena polygramma]|nr:hypothetical protein DFH06DRAFT_1150294 [Mycena polygramma]